MTSSMHFIEKNFTEEQVKTICEGFQNDELKTFSIRDCKVSFTQLKTILKNVEHSGSLLQLSLCVGIITDQKGIDLLCRTLKLNKSLQSLFIHGNPIGDEGMKKIAKILLHHPSITSLDVGDCNLSDNSVESICNLLPWHGKKSGLTELTLSSNQKITEQGWIKLSMSMAASSCLQELYLDYNNIGDLEASSVLVGLASHRHLQVLDLEGTCITDTFAKLLLYLIENYPTKLQKVNLEENQIDRKLLKTIKSCLLDIETESEMSEKTQDELESEYSYRVTSEVEEEEIETVEDVTLENEVKTLEATLNTATPLKRSPKKKMKQKAKLDETVKSTDSLWDGDELIEISEPPLIRSSTSLQSFGGVNLGQVVSVAIGRGSVQNGDPQEEELKEVKLSSVC